MIDGRSDSSCWKISSQSFLAFLMNNDPTCFTRVSLWHSMNGSWVGSSNIKNWKSWYTTFRFPLVIATRPHHLPTWEPHNNLFLSSLSMILRNENRIPRSTLLPRMYINFFSGRDRRACMLNVSSLQSIRLLGRNNHPIRMLFSS